MTNDLQRVIDKALANKEDVYKAAAVYLFGLSSIEEVTDEYRRAAKQVLYIAMNSMGTRELLEFTRSLRGES